mmetsp:Transcript_43880/g.83794  ORF Transcript_43880/g.83794 Transcript_43880/m.83794 type:complete len:354 (+) Transcript_43880:191-1252(+)|eukprot:CAMPEP_0114247602 /NCGR_PEP_ID=MMETSP0058-20121206/13111_1 /TAXON_ID=36894 /ORGANISM="Pyramimonas parkeae, CCMP726" /LENGTH=353 /DNA_ID=CAMNT_0001360921 /DNA_START=159 /DNA_END=1220 /DNA_ORIENTATION=-
MVKDVVDLGAQLPKEEIAQLVKRYGLGELTTVSKLYGGFSGSNYKVQDERGVLAVLKVCHSYSVEEVCDQAAVQGHLGACNFVGACSAIPLLSPEGPSMYVTTTPTSGEPALLLSFCKGKSADAVLEAGLDAGVTLQEIGFNLAKLHQVEPCAGLRSYTKSGACNLGEHLLGKWLILFRENEHVRAHEFVAFYESQLKELQAVMRTQGLPCGIIHGDPFLDNILVDEASGEFSAFVDFEDACVGPLLFDVACCAAAACYQGLANTLDMSMLNSLLTGYCSVRRFTNAEQTLFVKFMQMTMLCNCSWRFKNFNIDHREVEKCRDAHKELQDRIVDLNQPVLVKAINEMVAACNV